jgi:hypothetical protein
MYRPVIPRIALPAGDKIPVLGQGTLPKTAHIGEPVRACTRSPSARR